jgi:CRP-like cAMP-binding protein
VPPAVEDAAHAGYRTVPMSPRHVPASITELARVGLFESLPGETLGRLAERMQRDEVAAGTVLIEEGRPGDRFFVLLAGMASVSQASLGQRGVVRAGDFFGEVALTMRIPRTATVTAMTPCVVASCDAATFDELVRPIFADDGDADGADDAA